MKDSNKQIISKQIKIIFMALLPLVGLLTLGQTLLAQDVNDPQAVTAAQLSSSKSADVSEAYRGETVHYTISISNTGDTTASSAMMTDTLPIELDVVSGTLTATSWDTLQVDNNTVVWVGSVGGNGGQVQIEFDAVLTDTVVAGDLITNTAEITGTGSLLEPYAAIQVISETVTHTLFMPIIINPYPAVQIQSVGNPTNDGNWDHYSILVSWAAAEFPNADYYLQVSRSSDFSNATEYHVGNNTSYEVSNILATFDFPLWHFRVRYEINGITSNWSNTGVKHGVYFDRFNDPSSGWAIRRHDTDDRNDSTRYEDGRFVMKVGGRWDSILAGPLVPIPNGLTWDGYEIETYVQLGDGIDNLHSYGVIFGADWDGVSPCPDVSLLTCYNNYYRLNVVWGGGYLKAQVKRVDYHDPPNNKDYGEEIMSFIDVPNSDANGWNRWNIQVFNDGTIKLYINGHHLRTIYDNRYVGGGRYFGGFASSNEYLGAAPYYEYYKITPLP